MNDFSVYYYNLLLFDSTITCVQLVTNEKKNPATYFIHAIKTCLSDLQLPNNLNSFVGFVIW